MENYVWLEEIERLEAQLNNGKSLDGCDILESKKLSLLETLEWNMAHCGPAGTDFMSPLRIDKLKKGEKTVTRYYSHISFMDVEPGGRKLKRDLGVLKSGPM